MPTISGRSSVGTGATTANVILGSQYELAPFDATIEVGVLSTVNLVTMSLFAGPDVLAEPGSAVPVNATESMPIYPDNYHWEDTVAHGDRLKLIFNNANAGTAIINWAVRITPA